MKAVEADVRAWDEMKRKYTMDRMYLAAWEGAFIPSEAEIFWMFGAGIEFKVWCARRFLTELKDVLAQVRR